MKSVIVEIKGRYVAALCEDGCVTREKNQNYKLGQVIEVERAKNNKFRNRMIAYGATAAVAVLTVSISAWAYFTPYSYVSVDVNPSIAFSVNRFDKVLSAEAVNDDAQDILQNLDLKNKGIETAIAETTKELTAKGYFSQGDGGMVIAAANNDEDKAAKLSEKLKDKAEDTIDEAGQTAQVEAMGIGWQRVQEAKKLGVTPGKLNLVQKLQATDSSVKTEDWLDKPVKEIMKTIKQNKADSKVEASSEQTGSSNTVSSLTSSINKNGNGNANGIVNGNANSHSTEKTNGNAYGKDKESTDTTQLTDTASSSVSSIASSTESKMNGNANSNANRNANANGNGNGNGKS